MSDGESIAGREREVTFHTSSALTREQVEEVFNAVYWHGDQQGAKQCKVLDGIDALRATIEQQAQELGRCKSEKNYAVIELYRKLDAKDAELAASQARCRELEREIKSLTTCQCEGCDHNLEESAFCLPCMNKAQQQVAQLQATLAAREARIHDLERGLAAVLQVLQPFTEAQQAAGDSPDR